MYVCVCVGVIASVVYIRVLPPDPFLSCGSRVYIQCDP